MCGRERDGCIEGVIHILRPSMLLDAQCMACVIDKSTSDLEIEISGQVRDSIARACLGFHQGGSMDAVRVSLIILVKRAKDRGSLAIAYPSPRLMRLNVGRSVRKGG